MIKFYDFEFNLLGSEHRYTSLRWEIKYNDIGTFEAHLPLGLTDTVNIIMENEYLIAEQKGRFAIITGKQLNTEAVIYGRTLNWILSRRTTPKFKQLTGTCGELAKGFFNAAFSDIDNFAVQTDCETKTIDFWRNTRNVTQTVIMECLDNDGAGHEVLYDIENKQWIFRIYKGIERDCIISEPLKTAYDTAFSTDILDLYDGGWYEEQPETTEGTETDYESIWTYIEKDNPKTGIYHWEAVLSGANSSEAKTDLKKKKINEECEAKVRNLKYGVDYNLGDILRFQIVKGDFKKTVLKRVTAISLWNEQGSSGESPILSDMEE